MKDNVARIESKLRLITLRECGFSYNTKHRIDTSEEGEIQSIQNKMDMTVEKRFYISYRFVYISQTKPNVLGQIMR